MKLSIEQENFVAHFGEMGSRWGFNRTVGQMLALLVISEAPLSAENISSALHISRGNVSMAARELSSWQLIRTHREPGDRKDYYITNGTIWELAQQVMAERHKREVNPTLSLLRGQLMHDAEGEPQSYAESQIREIHDLLELFTQWFDDIQSMRPEHLRSLMKMGSGISKVFDLKDKLTGKTTK